MTTATANRFASLTTEEAAGLLRDLADLEEAEERLTSRLGEAVEVVKALKAEIAVCKAQKKRLLSGTVNDENRPLFSQLGESDNGESGEEPPKPKKPPKKKATKKSSRAAILRDLAKEYLPYTKSLDDEELVRFFKLEPDAKRIEFNTKHRHSDTSLADPSKAAEANKQDYEGESWRAVTIAVLSESDFVPPSTLGLLSDKAGVHTLGDLDAFAAKVEDANDKATWPKGIGPKKVSQLEAGLVSWLDIHAPHAIPEVK